MEIGKRETLLFWFIIGIQIHASLQFKLDGLNRDDFPENFIFGASTSAYQVEGAAQLDGRKPCIWDTYTHSGKMVDGSTGDVAADQYHHYTVISITALCLTGAVTLEILNKFIFY